jgi:hypothetical protein
MPRRAGTSFKVGRLLLMAGRCLAIALGASAWGICCIHAVAAAEDKVVVEIEEAITNYTNPNNGSGPLWCYGAPLLVRRGKEVFLSVMETGKEVPPLCNTRWQLWQRDEGGWRLAQHEADFREREPCPLGGFQEGRLFLSVNRSLSPPGTSYGAVCDPQLLQFDMRDPGAAPKVLRPAWAEGTRFTEHSYRGLAVDAKNNSLLMLNIHPEGHYFFTFRDHAGKWHPLQILRFPIRACYPQVVLGGRSAHVLAIGDIVEPVKEWRELKFQVLKREWDYVFRRLFYTFTPDVTKVPFVPPIEIETVENTAGHISNLDLYVDSRGRAHVLYNKQSHQYAFLRDKFFPGQPISVSLIHAVLDGGKVISRQVLLENVEGSKEMAPGWGRFHVTPGGRLYVIFYATWTDKEGKSHADNLLMALGSGSSKRTAVSLGLKHPLQSFFTNTTRGGSEPSRILDLFGVAEDPYLLRYARLRLD